MSTVRRFWIEFDMPEHGPFEVELCQGVGVTGFDERDCLSMVADLVDGPLPPVRRITVDISLAEPLPVNPPGLGVPVWRGVWYPPRNLRTGPMWRPRGVDRAFNPSYYPAPVAEPRRRVRASDTLRARTRWWDEIPRIDNLLWPLVYMHYAELGDLMWRFAPVVRDDVVTNPVYEDMVREALDYMIARRPTPSEWADPTRAWFVDQRRTGRVSAGLPGLLVRKSPGADLPSRQRSASTRYGDHIRRSSEGPWGTEHPVVRRKRDCRRSPAVSWTAVVGALAAAQRVGAAVGVVTQQRRHRHRSPR